jgi:MADS-box transcription factor
MKSIHTPVSSRASSLAAHFDTSRSSYDRPPAPPGLSHSVDSGAQNNHVLSNIPFSASPPPITTTTPGSTSSLPGQGQRPKLSLHIPDDEDPAQQADESGASATPGSASPEQTRDSDVKREHPPDDHREGGQFFLPPPHASALLPNGRLPGPGLGAFDNSNNSGGTPLSALPSRYAGDMLPSPSTFYPEFYGSLPSAGTSAMRGGGYSGIMNGTPVVSRSDDSASLGYSGYGGTGEKRRGEELASGAKRARS